MLSAVTPPLTDLQVDVSATLQEELDNLHVPVLCGEHQQGVWNLTAVACLTVSIEESVGLPAFIQPQSHRSHAAVRSRLQDVLWDFTTSRRWRAERGVLAREREAAIRTHKPEGFFFLSLFAAL